MKTSNLLSSLLFFFFGFLLFSGVSASGSLSFGLDRSKTTDTGLNVPVPCNTPTWPLTSNITQSSATFSWDAVYGATSYAVQTRVPNGTWFNVPGSPTNYTSITVDWFLPNTTYEWRVKANCGYGESSYWTAPVTFTTSGWGYCQPPAWLFTNNVTQTSATLDWDPVSGAVGYAIQYRVAGGGSWWNVPGGPFTETWYTLTGLTPGTTYEWRVKSECSNWMYSEWSYIAEFTTLSGYCNHPYWLYSSNITDHSARLNWDYVPGAWSYDIQFRVAGGAWYQLPGGPFTNTWHTVYGLEPTTCYEWRVRSNCSNWTYSSWSYDQSFCTSGYSCNTPTWPSTWDISQTSATFDWDAVWGAYDYVVQIRHENGEWYDVAGSPTHYTWITVNGLTPCNTYHWRVKAHCGGGEYSYWTVPVTFTTYCEYYCHAPLWLNTTNVTTTSAKLDWEPVYGAVSYSIQFRVAGGIWDYLPGGPFTGTWTTVNGLQPGTTYEWRIRSNCSDWSYSPWSYPAYFTTLGYGCSRPSFLYTLDITTNSATLDWSSSWGAWSYDVQIKEVNGTWSNVPGSPFTGTSTTVTGLNPGTTYQWRVRAYCEDGNYSHWAKPVSFKTLSEPTCYAPYWVYTTYITESSANFDWAGIINAVSYDIQWRLAGDTTWIDLPGGPWTETWHTVSGLQPGTDYEWRVRSNCSNGLQSDWSSIAAFTTAGPSCNIPTGTVTTDIGETTATFNWSAVSGASTYAIQLRVPYGAWYDAPGNPFTETTVTISGFIQGTTYEWRVRTNCTNGDHSDWTSILSFTTGGTAASGSDECDNATQLTVNSSCQNTASSNDGATESSPAPMGWCPENEYNDVWFTFTMPDVPDPVVTIRTSAGTLTDGIMEVYRGGDCNSLSYIFCEDDNTWHNGSTMPVITVSGSPNETIWVRVWGYAGTTGTFNICVFNYASNDLVVPDDASENISEGQPVHPLENVEYHAKDLSTSLHVSPNPTHDVLQVTLGQTDKTRVTRIVLLDLTGNVIFRKDYTVTDAHQFTDQLDVSGYTPEMYLLQVMTTSGTLTEKVIIAK